MKCHYCGAEIADGTAFCLNCGTRQELQSVAEPVRIPEPVCIRREETLPEPVFPAAPVPEPAAELPQVTDRAAEEAFPVIRPAARQTPPALQLPTKRGLGKMVFLGILTLGIYPTVIWSRIVAELNIAASRYDGRRTVSYFGMLMLAPLTLGIFPLVWIHNFCFRIREELDRRGIGYSFGPRTFWLWGVLGTLILVGPFVYIHKLMKAMNQINADFNING